MFPAVAQTALDAATIERRAGEWIRPYVAAGDSSGVVLVAQGDRILVEKAYGKADFERDVRNQIGTRFRIASLSKTFTAAAIDLLVAQGKVSLKDPLGKYVSGIANGDKITIEQLLTHHSGVGELDAPEVTRDCLSQDELLKRVRDVAPLFAPGTDSQYSNEGYFLLAVIQEKVSGVRYSQYLEKNVFAPLGMTNRGSKCKGMPAGANAAGYVPGDRAGSLYSNAHDLFLWMRAVDGNPSFQVGVLGYPNGWGKRNYSGRDLIEQTGSNEGYNAHMAVYPKEHLYVVILSNVQSGLSNRLPKDVEAVLFGGEVSKPPEGKATAVSAAELREYSGTYRTKSIPLPQNLFVQDGRLFTRWGTYAFPRMLTPTGKDEIFFRYEYAKVRFERDSKGNILKMGWQWPEAEPLAFTPADSH